MMRGRRGQPVASQRRDGVGASRRRRHAPQPAAALRPAGWAALAAHALTAEDAGGADTPSLVLSPRCWMLAPSRRSPPARRPPAGSSARSMPPAARGGGASPDWHSRPRSCSTRLAAQRLRGCPGGEDRFGALPIRRGCTRVTRRLDGVVGVEAFEVVCARLGMARRAAGRTASVSWRRSPTRPMLRCTTLSDAFGSGGAVALGGARASRRGAAARPPARASTSLLATPPATSTLSSGSPTQSVQLQAQAEPLPVC